MDPAWQLAATVQIPNALPPFTPLPQALSQCPLESNFWIRLLPWSATYTLPAPSVAIPPSRFISPPMPPLDPAWQWAATVQMPNALPPFTPLPQARSQLPVAARAGAAHANAPTSTTAPANNTASRPRPPTANKPNLLAPRKT